MRVVRSPPSGCSFGSSTPTPQRTSSTRTPRSSGTASDGGQSISGASVQKFDAAGNVLLGPDALTIIPMDAALYIPNTINDVLDGVQQALDEAERNYMGLVIWQTEPPFSVLEEEASIAANRLGVRDVVAA